jgi:hypothetical protein
VGVEHRGTWPHDVRLHRDDAVRAFLEGATTAGWRPLLVRKPGRRPSDGPTRVFLADTAPPTSRVAVLRVTNPAELAEIVLPEPDGALPGEAVSDPMLLVCTHGRRDRCCAVDGRALARAVAARGEPDVWECTHLGGHRFAPTALVLPTGYVYGRLDVAEAVAALKAATVGEAEPAQCRGRSTWTAPGQVAELAVRGVTGLRDADVLRVESETEPAQRRPADVLAGLDTDDATRVVVIARDGRRWEVTVQDTPCPGRRPVSCGAAALPVSALHASQVRLLT